MYTRQRISCFDEGEGSEMPDTETSAETAQGLSAPLLETSDRETARLREHSNRGAHLAGTRAKAAIAEPRGMNRLGFCWVPINRQAKMRPTFWLEELESRKLGTRK